MSTPSRTQKLRALVDLVNKASETVIGEWEKQDSLNQCQSESSESALPSWELYNAQRTIISACGSFTELMHNPQLRLIEVSAEFLESRALHIAAEHRIADVLAGAGSNGVPIDTVASKIGINALKLARVMRVLTSAHIFQEVKENYFANNHVSACLVDNEPLRAYILVLGVDTFTGACKLPDVLRDPVKTHSTSPAEAPLSEALGISLTYWDWLESDVKQPDGSTGPNPSLETFTLGMLGNGRVMSGPVCFDYPWSSLGNGLVVDVGGGIGSMSLDLARLYPDLHFIVQDRPALIEQAKMVWATEYPEALASRVSLTPHDFFQVNPVKGADAYLLRYIIHDWQDDQSVEILKGIRESMADHSRILLVDQVMNTTLGCEGLASAPSPLLADYGVHSRMLHALDMIIITLANGTERNLTQLRALALRAGLEVTKVWECRGVLSVTELRLPSGGKV